MAQLVKSLPPVQETWVQSLGREAPLEKEMSIHSSILAWRIELGGVGGRAVREGSLVLCLKVFSVSPLSMMLTVGWSKVVIWPLLVEICSFYKQFVEGLL